MFECCSLLLIGRFRGAPHGSLPFLMPVALYCGPRPRKTGAPSLLESFVDVPRAWLANQLGIDIVPVDLNLVASEILPAGNPFRVLLEVLEALAAGSPDILENLGGFAGTIVAGRCFAASWQTSCSMRSSAASGTGRTRSGS